MLPVYICEDHDALRADLKDFLQKLILMEGYDMEVALSSGHPEEILRAAEHRRARGIYFLDVELTGESMDGFTLGQKIRKLDSRGFLVYVTAFRDLAFETFRYHLEALDYIVKDEAAPDPFTPYGGRNETMYDGIRRSLAVITERMQKEQGEKREFFTVKVMDVVKHIPVDEIMFFETTGRTHRIALHGRCGRMDFIGSMRKLEEALGSRFLRVHRAYLVNTEQILELDLKHREIRMQNGETCFFSRIAKGELLNRV